jgi:ferritin heavy chain
MESLNTKQPAIESMARQNFSKACEEALNEQINAELTASLVYRSMAAYFDRDDVALKGFRKVFLHNAEEESEHAQEFINYLNKRGGRVALQAISAPKTEWTSALEALEDALALEKIVNEKLLRLHSVAAAANDPQMTDFIEGGFLKEQVEAIKDLADKITNLKRVGEGLGVFLFNQQLE